MNGCMHELAWLAISVTAYVPCTSERADADAVHIPLMSYMPYFKVCNFGLARSVYMGTLNGTHSNGQRR